MITNRKIKILLVILIGCIKISAQNLPITKSNYQLAERFSPNKLEKMVFSTSIFPQWLDTGDKFWYSYKTSKGTCYYIVDPKTKSKRLLFDNHKMAGMLNLLTKESYDDEHLPQISPQFKNNATVFQFDLEDSQGKWYHLEYSLLSGKLYENKNWQELKNSPYWASISPDSSYCVYEKNFNLFYMDKSNYEKAFEDEKDPTIVEYQLTTDGEAYYSYNSYSEDVVEDPNETEQVKNARSRERFPVYGYWSPDSKKFAITRKDARHLKFMWVINSLAEPRPTLKSYRQLQPSEVNPTEEELLVFNMEKRERNSVNVKQFLNQSLDIDNGFGSIKHKKGVWLSDDPNKLYFRRTSRDRRQMELCEVDLKTYEINVVIHEQSNYFLADDVGNPTVINNGHEIIWVSDRDGWCHFYLYDSDGNLKNQITLGAFHCSVMNYWVDEKKRVLYFEAKGMEQNENPYYSHSYKINLDGSGLTLLNKGNFDNQIFWNKAAKLFVDNYSRVNTVPKSVLKDTEGNVIMDLETADLSNLFNSGYKFPEPFELKAADGVTNIYGVMYKPFDFDPSKSYPVLQYVYPGPPGELINTSFSTDMDFTDRLAQLGYIVIVSGNRGGSRDRSGWYYHYGYGDLRDYALADKKYAAEQLAYKYSFMDINRVGVIGHSAGGQMAAAAICQYPDFYKVAVSYAGPHDYHILYTSYGEQFQGVKIVKNEDGNERVVTNVETNLELAKNLKGRLLLVSGDMDDNVNPANTFKMADALIKANKRFDMFIMPTQTHNFYGHYEEYAFWLYADYFGKYLMGDDSNSKSIDILEIRRESKGIK